MRLTRCSLSCCVTLLAFACSNGSDSSGVPQLSLAVELDRRAQAGPDAILVRVTANRGAAPAEGVQLAITAAGRSLPVVEASPGAYTSEFVPASECIEVPLSISAEGMELERVALVMTDLDDAWGQAEAVPGLVNTRGHEDSSEISPDGQWLIVSTYSPVDLVSCLAPPSNAGSSACNQALGAHLPPSRPNMPGSNRILTPTLIDHTIPRLGLTPTNVPPWSGPLPPVAAYGFHRQSDGSFAEPFVIAFDAEGFPSAPFGMTFTAAPFRGQATIVYAWDDPSTANQDADLHRAEIALGAPNILGVMTGTFPIFSIDPPAERLPQADFSGVQSNPFVANDGVFFDQHDAGGEPDLFFLPGSWELALGTPLVVALSQPGRTEYQPFERENRLYFACSDASGDFKELRSAQRTAGADPSLANSWGAERVELSISNPAPDTELIAIGEPSLALDQGRTWLYFVYGKRTATGVDANIGRVATRRP